MQACPRCAAAIHPQARFCGQCGVQLGAPHTAEQRKIVTVVFCGVIWHRSDQLLDLELRGSLEYAWYETARDILASHGGTVRKHAAGEPVMAVFGVPRVHEDDALRAVRAAEQLRHQLAALSSSPYRTATTQLQMRAGVHTGEAMTRTTAAFEPFAYGDTVNVAARLEQSAVADEILISEATWLLVREAVEADPRPPLIVRGRKAAVKSRRLRAVRPITARPGREFDTPLIGRSIEQQLFELFFERAIQERTCHQITFLGSPGIGKSRLAAEIEKALAGRAKVLWGRCLVYGDDVTYWPMIEVVSQAARIGPADPPESIRMRLASLVEGDERAARIATGLAEMLGLESDGLQEDVLWALRTLFELLARREPLVVILEDLHWARDTLLDTVDHLAEWCHDAPILIVCLARSELLERRPTWGGGRAEAASVMLSPLSKRECHVLMAQRPGGGELDPELKAEAILTAEGNPLFIEEIVAMLSRAQNQRQDEHATESLTKIPSTIQAVLTARIDQLENSKQTVLERAAIVGKRFQHSAVIELCDPAIRPSVALELQALVHMDLIRPDRGGVLMPVPEDEGYQFRHGLIRDVAYQRLPKQARAVLHERYANWYEQIGKDSQTRYELVGQHLELAYRYSWEVGREGHAGLAQRAARKLASAGQRAIARGDIPATRSILARAAALLSGQDLDKIDVLLDLAVSLQRAGELDMALKTYDNAASLARAAKSQGHTMRVHLRRFNALWYTDLNKFLTEGREAAERGVKAFAESADYQYVGLAWRLLAGVNATLGHSYAALKAIDNAIDAAHRAENELLEAQSLITKSSVLHSSAIRNDDVVEDLEDILLWAVSKGARRLEASIFSVKAHIAAMEGRFNEARSLLASSRAIMAEMGEVLMGAGHSVSVGVVELLAGDLEAAERELRAGCDALAAIGAITPLSAAKTWLARVLLLEGRLDEAASTTQVCRRITAAGNLSIRTNLHGIRAVLLVHDGKKDAAERLSQKVVNLASSAEEPEPFALALRDLAEVYYRTGRFEEANRAVRQAIHIYEAKGNVVAVDGTRQTYSTRRYSTT